MAVTDPFQEQEDDTATVARHDRRPAVVTMCVGGQALAALVLEDV